MSIMSLAACGKDAAVEETVDVDTATPAVTLDGGKDTVEPVKPHGPIRISYRIIGEPIVGRPVLIDLKVTSSMGPQPVKLDYRLPDTSAMEFPTDQLRSVTLAPPQGLDAERPEMSSQVSVVPQREGRLYLNVSAEVETPEGPMSTVTAIPLQVGSAPRELQENGTVIEGEDGELIRSLPAAER